MEKTSSFQKRGKARLVNIPGTRPSVHNAQLVTSTGISSLDHILGGGLPVGSVLLVEEDKYNVYSKVISRYFIAEGIANNHKITIACEDESPEELLKCVPSPIDLPNDTKVQNNQEQMTIAWRYQGQKVQDNLPFNQFSHDFDLTKHLDVSLVEKENINLVHNLHNDSSNIYFNLLEKIKKVLSSANLFTSVNKCHSNVMRIVLSSLGSPFWGEDYNNSSAANLTKFLYMLKAVVRSSFSVVIVTIPSHIFTNVSLISNVYNFVDFAFKLESFQGSKYELNPIFKEYHGLFHMVKHSALNTLVPRVVATCELVFKLKRKGLKIEKLYLPPDIVETKTTNCSGDKLPKAIDF